MFKELEQRRENGLHRYMRTAGSSRPRTEIDGEEAVILGSNNYLGLTSDERLVQAATRGAKSHGTGAGASRLISGNLEAHTELENRLADHKNSDDALVFSSGYAANVGTINALLGEQDAVFSDELNHASIIDGCKLSGAHIEVYNHCDPDDLQQKFESVDARRKLVVTDSVFSMDGDIAPLKEIAEITDRDNAYAMVDEAHATGVFGEKGRGVVNHLELDNEIEIQMGTLSKALASQGGFIASSNEVIDLLVNEARSFVYSTGLSPIDAEVAKEALDITRSSRGDDLRAKLFSNVETLKHSLTEIGFRAETESQILPVIVGSTQNAVKAAETLEHHGVYAPAIRPPTVPAGTSRIRLSVTAEHTEQEVQRVIEAFKHAYEKIQPPRMDQL